MLVPGQMKWESPLKDVLDLGDWVARKGEDYSKRIVGAVDLGREDNLDLVYECHRL